MRPREADPDSNPEKDEVDGLGGLLAVPSSAQLLTIWFHHAWWNGVAFIFPWAHQLLM